MLGVFFEVRIGRSRRMTDFSEKGGAVEFCAVFSWQGTTPRRFGTEFNSLRLLLPGIVGLEKNFSLQHGQKFASRVASPLASAVAGSVSSHDSPRRMLHRRCKFRLQILHAYFISSYPLITPDLRISE